MLDFPVIDDDGLVRFGGTPGSIDYANVRQRYRGSIHRDELPESRSHAALGGKQSAAANTAIRRGWDMDSLQKGA